MGISIVSKYVIISYLRRGRWGTVWKQFLWSRISRHLMHQNTRNDNIMVKWWKPQQFSRYLIIFSFVGVRTIPRVTTCTTFDASKYIRTKIYRRSGFQDSWSFLIPVGLDWLQKQMYLDISSRIFIVRGRVLPFYMIF